jgi:hypothetical protein
VSTCRGFIFLRRPVSNPLGARKDPQLAGVVKCNELALGVRRNPTSRRRPKPSCLALLACPTLRSGQSTRATITAGL